MKTIIILTLLISLASTSSVADDNTNHKCTAPPEQPKPNRENRFNSKIITEANDINYVSYEERLKEIFRKSKSSGNEITDLENEIASLKKKLYNDEKINLDNEVKDKKILSKSLILKNLDKTRLAELYYLSQKNK